MIESGTFYNSNIKPNIPLQPIMSVRSLVAQTQDTAFQEVGFVMDTMTVVITVMSTTAVSIVNQYIEICNFTL